MANGKVPPDLTTRKSIWREREPGRASGIALAEQYGDERTARQLGATRFLEPPPSGRYAVKRQTAKKKRTARRTGR